MKDLQLSVYDMFGYVFPGAISLLGVYLLAIRFLHLVETQYWTLVTTSGWVAFVAVAYLLGHLIQALANILFDKPPSAKCTLDSSTDKVCDTATTGSKKVFRMKQDPEERLLGSLPDEVRALANTRAKTMLGMGQTPMERILGLLPKKERDLLHAETKTLLESADAAKLDTKTLYNAMDHFVRQNGRTADLDVFICREGFYRGMVVSSVVLAIGCFATASGNIQVTLAAFGFHFSSSTANMIVGGISSIAAAILTFCRYRRFGEYRVQEALYGFLTLRTPNQPNGP